MTNWIYAKLRTLEKRLESLEAIDSKPQAQPTILNLYDVLFSTSDLEKNFSWNLDAPSFDHEAVSVVNSRTHLLSSEQFDGHLITEPTAMCPTFVDDHDLANLRCVSTRHMRIVDEFLRASEWTWSQVANDFDEAAEILDDDEPSDYQISPKETTHTMPEKHCCHDFVKCDLCQSDIKTYYKSLGEYLQQQTVPIIEFLQQAGLDALDEPDKCFGFAMKNCPKWKLNCPEVLEHYYCDSTRNQYSVAVHGVWQQMKQEFRSFIWPLFRKMFSPDPT